ncbi:MAG: hypothetical protein EU549_02165, partial [Promethearchaeota archaeon]
NIKDQTSIKRGVFVFPPPIMISDALPTIIDFARSVVENIAFGIYENYTALEKFQIKDIYCAGGMSKSKEILKVIADMLGTNLLVPEFRDSSFTGGAMNTLIALDYYQDYKSIVNELINFEGIVNNPAQKDKYQELYLQWKNIKSKIDSL